MREETKEEFHLSMVNICHQILPDLLNESDAYMAAAIYDKNHQRHLYFCRENVVGQMIDPIALICAGSIKFKMIDSQYQNLNCVIYSSESLPCKVLQVPIAKTGFLLKLAVKNNELLESSFISLKKVISNICTTFVDKHCADLVH